MVSMRDVILIFSLALSTASVSLSMKTLEKMEEQQKAMEVMSRKVSLNNNLAHSAIAENYILEEKVQEFQEWREIVTVASRSGWGAANRYIAQYPLRAEREEEENGVR